MIYICIVLRSQTLTKWSTFCIVLRSQTFELNCYLSLIFVVVHETSFNVYCSCSMCRQLFAERIVREEDYKQAHSEVQRYIQWENSLYFVHAHSRVPFVYAHNCINAPAKCIPNMHLAIFYFSCTHAHGISLRIMNLQIFTRTLQTQSGNFERSFIIWEYFDYCCVQNIRELTSVYRPMLSTYMFNS